MTERHLESDLDKADALRRMKRLATLLFVAATVLFVIARLLEGHGGAVGYVEAFAEAAMVGALADWFAVTALFRHPLGIPIPHTAIIPHRKDQIGRSLGEFVQSEFLSSEVIIDRLRGFEVVPRFGGWLTEPANAARAAEALADGVRAALEVLDDADVQRALEQLVERRVRDTPVAPLLGRAVEVAIEGGHHQRLLDSMLTAVSNFLHENRSVLREKLSRESPVVGARADRRPHLRQAARRRAVVPRRGGQDPRPRAAAHARAAPRPFGERLRHDPELLARGEALKEELLAHPEVRAWLGSLWGELRTALIAASHEPSSELRRRMTAGLTEFGHRVGDDPALAAKVEGWVEGAVAHVLVRYRGEVAELIASTVDRWDAESTSAKLELQVGRDLQFIRINGTLVGGLAGVAIYAVGRLIA